MNLADLSLTSIKLCSPVIVFIVYVIVSGVSLYMSRNVLKRFNFQDRKKWQDRKIKNFNWAF